MRALLDTSVLVRYLTNDPPELALAADQIIEREEELAVTPVALAECGFVLTVRYGVSRPEAVDALLDLVQRTNLSVVGLETPLVAEALLLCRPSGRVSFADALIWAEARQTGHGVVYTFDRRFPRDGIELRDSVPAT